MQHRTAQQGTAQHCAARCERSLTLSNCTVIRTIRNTYCNTYGNTVISLSKGKLEKDTVVKVDICDRSATNKQCRTTKAVEINWKLYRMQNVYTVKPV